MHNLANLIAAEVRYQAWIAFQGLSDRVIWREAFVNKLRSWDFSNSPNAYR